MRVTGKFVPGSLHVAAIEVKPRAVWVDELYGVGIEVLVERITPIVTATHAMGFHRPSAFHPTAFVDLVNVVIAENTAASPEESVKALDLIGEFAHAGRPRPGNAAALSHATRGQNRPPVGQVLIYPGLGGNIDEGSYVFHADAPMLKRSDMDFYQAKRSGGADGRGDATYAALWDTDFTNLPPTFIASAECDPLSDDGDVYARRIVEAGGSAVWLNDRGLVHGHLRARHRAQRARESFDRIVKAIYSLGHTGELP